MRSTIGSAFAAALCAALTLSACAGPPRDSAPSPGGLAEREWTPRASAEEIAEWAMEGCGGEWEARKTCLEGALVSVIEPVGVDRAIGALAVIAQQDADVQREGHVFAHGIGIAAYRSPETVSRTYALCTADFQSGCYHGVIQAYFADAAKNGGITAEKLNALCADYRTPEGRWLEFQCAHGMGHGLMAVNGQHLLKALDACDLLADDRERRSCWGGAFMENIVNATTPHHTATTQLGGGHEHGGHEAASGGAAAAGEHAGHGDDHAGASGHDHGGEKAAEEPFKALDPEQPLYPCTVVKEHHRFACYQMQTSPILHRSNGDFPAAAAICQTAPEEFIRVCFTSLGRDANAWGRGDSNKVIELCGAAPVERQPWCIVGAVKNVVDVTADARDGFEFCKLLGSGGNKNACYRAVGEQISVLHATPEARERTCNLAEHAYVNECRAGARLPAPGVG
jgi:hypothetical protein